VADLQSAALATWLRSLLSKPASSKLIDCPGCSECVSLGQHEFRRIACSRCLAPSCFRCLAPISPADFHLPGPQIASIPPRPGQVPGTEFQPGLAIASIPPRLGQVPGTEFQPGPRLLASLRVLDRCLARLGQVPGTGFQPGLQIASIPPRLGQVPGTDFQPGLQIASIPPPLGQVPGTDFQPGP
jgi:hypothetical protein